MDKLLIRLWVPAVQETFDLFVPADMTISELIKVLVRGVEDLCGGKYESSRREMLNSADPDLLLHPDRTLSYYGIKNGAELVLM